MRVVQVVTRVFLRWFWYTVYGTGFHKLLVRLLYFPSIGRMCLLEGPNRRWYDRIDDTVILGALPFRSQAKQVGPHRHTHTNTSTHTHTQTRPHTLVHTHTHTHVHIHSYTHTHKHKHMFDALHVMWLLSLLQLVEVENVRTVISYNEEYELNYFTNSKKVSRPTSILYHPKTEHKISNPTSILYQLAQNLESRNV